jgi:hypothetical protein
VASAGVGEAGDEALMGVKVLEGGEQGVQPRAAQAQVGELGVGGGEGVTGVAQGLGQGEVLRLLEGRVTEGRAGVTDLREVAVDRWGSCRGS